MGYWVMFDSSLVFNSPWFLVLLAIVPLLWWTGRTTMAAMGRLRALLAFGLRALVVAVFVLALAETQTRQTSRAVSVVYLLDQSLSIPAAERHAMFQHVVRAVETHRQAARGDRVGIIVFGREATVEVPVVEDDLAWLRPRGGHRPRLAEATNLASALKLAQSILPADGARRVLIVTDGNENLGTARRIAPQLADQGIGIDVVPVHLPQPNDVEVEKIVLPAMPQQGETIEARVVIVNHVERADAADGGRVPGKLRVTRQAGAKTELLVEQHVELAPGKSVFPLVHTLDAPPGFYTYEARFLPDDADAERTSENNRAAAFTRIGGKGRVLFIENADAPGEFAFLIERLRASEILVDQRTSDQPFENLADLQSYDTVVLANVARSSGSEAETLISDDQIEALVRNTEMGCGLVMLGGPRSFGAGGWANTRLEEASPVSFTIRNAKVVPSGALALVIDKSGSMQGEKMVMCRQAAAEAVRVLGANDHIGVVAFDGAARTVVPIQQVQGRRERIASRIRRLDADGGTDMFPGMRQALVQLQSVEAAVKHMIVLTDGQTQAGDFENLTRALRRANVTVSAVAVGNDADRNLLGRIAHQGGGKFYHVTSPRAIPRIFVKEAMRVSKPLVYEREEGFSPQMVFPHEMLTGLEGPFPPITGFVLTDAKTSPLVEVALRSPLPADDQTSTILASWQYGLGRFVVFTTDAGRRWASSWTQWENYDALFTQIVRWSMRPGGHEDDHLVAASVEDGKIRIIVTALDEKREFVNFLDMAGRVTTPDLQTVEMRIGQTAPGRYVGELAVDDPGSYFVAIDPGRGRGAIRLGVSVPHAAEFKDREPNWPLLRSLASQTPVGGEPGVLFQEQRDSVQDRELLALDPFRSTLAAAQNLRDAWPLLLMIAACVFFADVLVRRVAIDPAGMFAALRTWLRKRPRAEAREQLIERLRRRKAEVHQQLGHHPAAARFEPAAVDDTLVPRDANPGNTEPIARPLPASSAIAPEEAEPLPYTARLLKTKRELQERHPRAHHKTDERE
jgi:Mg-chelatase subunit ChlD